MVPRQRKEFHRFGKILSRNGRAIRINQTNTVETALEQVLSCKKEAFTEIFPTLWQQTEIGRQNIGVVRFGPDRRVNRNPSRDWPRVRPSETAATNRNRSACILQETPVELRRLLICKRRDRRVFTFPARGALVISANAEQPSKSLAAVSGSTTRCPLHLLRCRLLSFLAKSVLVAAILPGPKLFPWLRREKVRESFRREYRRLVWLPITISGWN